MFFRDFELFRNMGTGSIDDHHEKVVGMCRRDLCEEGAKGFGVHFLGERGVGIVIPLITSTPMTRRGATRNCLP